MHRVFYFLLIIMLHVSYADHVSAASSNTLRYDRDFLYPKYHSKLLSYCSSDHQICGQAVADRYCQFMGYEKASKQVIAYPVKIANFIDRGLRCYGWQCHGFKLITCQGQLSHKPPKVWHYRARHFTYPYYEQGRVAWCYDGKTGCGRKAAHSFCRRLGFMTARRYQIDPHGMMTKAIGNQKLCYGKTCQAFKYIDCHR